MATLVASWLLSMAPWVNDGEIEPTPTPRPICIGFDDEPPTDWLTRSENCTALALNPTVLIFARLLPITPKYMLLARSPESAAENEPRAIDYSPPSGGVSSVVSAFFSAASSAPRSV